MEHQNKASQFKFSNNDTVGAAGAEEDREFLEECFVPTGDLPIAENFGDYRQIIIGRTGAGKTALLSEIEKRHPNNIISIKPENLALTYVSNSNIIKFFSDLGVNLDPFFKLLWRHVLVVEVLQKYFANRPDKKEKSFWEYLRKRFVGSTKEEKTAREAIDYLESWGSKFWEETEFRIKEITKKVEDELEGEFKSSLGTSDTKISSGLLAKQKLSEEQKAELTSRAQIVISKAQVQDLNKTIQLLDQIVTEKHKGYYITIDQLDENWVEEKLRYRLIMALMLTAKEFIKVENVKVLVSMRKDLMERVFRLTRESGFQEEKFESLYLRLIWSKSQLVEILDKRIDHLVKRRYTKAKVTHLDLLPKVYNGEHISDFITKRAPRPRDIIDFFNKCILAGDGKAKLGKAELKLAEGEYSRSRLKALGDEWGADFPELLDYSRILHKTPPSFKLKTVDETKVEAICLELVSQDFDRKTLLHLLAKKYVEGVIEYREFMNVLMQTFYKVGLLGLKTNSSLTASWSDEKGRSVSLAEIDEDTSIVINQTYHRALGTINSKH